MAILMELGFDEPTARLAADAAGGEADRAAAMLLEGEECGGQRPVDVHRWAHECLS